MEGEAAILVLPETAVSLFAMVTFPGATVVVAVAFVEEPAIVAGLR